jgi:hypothetical protein
MVLGRARQMQLGRHARAVDAPRTLPPFWPPP